jgi:hypothetical protein
MAAHRACASSQRSSMAFMAGDDKSKKNVPAKANSTVYLALMSTLSIPTMEMFPLKEISWMLCKLKLLQAS